MIDQTGLQQLGPMHCISLASVPQRRAFCRRQFDVEGLSEVRFFDGIVPADAGAFPSRGARGCYLSHRAVIERALAERATSGAAVVTIFEDDVLLPRDFGRIVADVMRQLAEVDWHLCYWGMVNDPPLEPVPGREPLATIAPAHPIIGKQAYSVRLDHAEPLVEYLRYCETHHPSYSDGMFHQYRMLNSVTVHTHVGRLARQGSFTSNITPRHENHWLRRQAQCLKRAIQLFAR